MDGLGNTQHIVLFVGRRKKNPILEFEQWHLNTYNFIQTLCTYTSIWMICLFPFDVECDAISNCIHFDQFVQLHYTICCICIAIVNVMIVVNRRYCWCWTILYIHTLYEYNR